MIQVTKCPCGKTFAGCIEPYCYQDAEYQRDTRNYIKKGCTIEMVESGSFILEKCTCPNMKPVGLATPQLSIF